MENDSPTLQSPNASEGFDRLPLTAATREALREAGLDSPLPVQMAAFDPIRAGKDVIIQARTGTGKTLAFGLPIIDALPSVPQGPAFLVLAPTRELALQDANELQRVGTRSGLRLAVVYGGVAIEPQLRALREGVHGIVGTPGRIMDVLERMPEAARGLRIFVLDEVDEMLSMGFERDVEAIVQRFPGRYQGVFLSATLPANVARLAERFLREPAHVNLSEDGVSPPEIRHLYVMVDPMQRLRDLIRLLEADRPQTSFIFCNTRDDAQIVSSKLREHGFPAELLSGELSQADREKVMRRVREGKVAHLVATDLAARGLDVLHLTHVINYQFPQSLEIYIHRTGRVGRLGQIGTAVSLVGPQDVGNFYFLRLTYGIKPLERALPTERDLAREREAAVVRTLAARFAGRPTDPAALAVLRRLLTRVDGEAVLAALVEDLVKPEELRAEAERIEERRRRAAAMEAEERAKRDAERRAEPPTAAEAAPAAERADDPGRRRRRRGPERPAEPRPAPSERREPSPAPEPPPADGPAEPAAAPAEPPPADAPSGVEPADAPPPPVESRRGGRGPVTRNVFLNVGTEDGVDGDFLVQWLQARLAVRSSELGPVRVKEHSTVVPVPADRLADAIGALTGLRFGGREVVAEEARRR